MLRVLGALALGGLGLLVGFLRLGFLDLLDLVLLVDLLVLLFGFVLHPTKRR